MSSTQSSYEEISLSSETSISVGDGETYSDVLIRTNGHNLSINAYGSGWTVRNVGIIGEGDYNEASIRPQVPGDPNGEGLIEHCYTENITNNFNFVNRHHEGHITYRACTFINNLNPPEHIEDTIYGSSPGNPGEPIKPIGWAGTIDVIDCYTEDIGGYGFRISPDGSRVINCTIVASGSGKVNKALANNFGGGFTGYEGNHPAEPPGVLFRNCDVGGRNGGAVSTGLQVGPHQSDKYSAMTYAAITEIENCRIDANYPIRAYTCEGGTNPPHYPVVNGVEYPPTHPGNEARLEVSDVAGLSSGADLTPPAAAPQSATEAASGSSDRSIIRLSAGGG